MTVASNALCSLDEVLEYGGLQDKVPNDNTLLENIINRMTPTFHTIAGVDQFKSKTYTEYYNGSGDPLLFVKRKPIISIDSIYDDLDWVWGSGTLIDSSYYRIVDNLYIAFKDYYPLIGRQNVKIIYSAGYETIPLDIKQACIEEVLRKFNRRKDFDVTAKTLEDGSITYTEKDLLLQTRNLLKSSKYSATGIY